jgi:hypothetical protein
VVWNNIFCFAMANSSINRWNTNMGVMCHTEIGGANIVDELIGT